MIQRLFSFMHEPAIPPLPRSDLEARLWSRWDLWDAIGEVPWEADRGWA